MQEEHILYLFGFFKGHLPVALVQATASTIILSDILSAVRAVLFERTHCCLDTLH